MSSPLAIGAVSAVLRNLLDNGLVEAGAAMGSTVAVSAVAPDTIDPEPRRNDREPNEGTAADARIRPDPSTRPACISLRFVQILSRRTHAALYNEHVQGGVPA